MRRAPNPKETNGEMTTTMIGAIVAALEVAGLGAQGGIKAGAPSGAAAVATLAIREAGLDRGPIVMAATLKGKEA